MAFDQLGEFVVIIGRKILLDFADLFFNDVKLSRNHSPAVVTGLPALAALANIRKSAISLWEFSFSLRRNDLRARAPRPTGWAAARLLACCSSRSALNNSERMGNGLARSNLISKDVLAPDR